MTYITADDIKDEILADRVDADILTETDSEINGIVYSLGSTPEIFAAVDPIPYEAKQTAIAFACYRAALYASGNVAYGVMPGGFQDSNSDIFSRKTKIWWDDYVKKKGQLTKEIVEGNADTRIERVAVVELARS